MPPLIIPTPWPPSRKKRIHPVFITFMGCPSRCVFCSQEIQSGTAHRPIAAVLAELENFLEEAAAAGSGPMEISFYGGTFTLLPLEAQLACLSLAGRYRKTGLVTSVRASTRPDSVSDGLLATLAEAGLDMLELGVQSFTDEALAVSARGYYGKTAFEACRTVKRSGLGLGIQLMPGMPGMSAADFKRDWQTTLSLAPDALRLYPCLVLAETVLAAMYAAGEFTPWTLEKTLPLLAEAFLASWKSGVPVIRIGLAPQDELDNGGILAGPYHPALGSMVHGLALFQYIREHTPAGAQITSLRAPKYMQGEFWGHKNALVPAYADLGLHKKAVSFEGEADIAITYQQILS